MFRDRKILIATKHRKEDAIGPILSSSFNLACYTLPGLDTDALGTFTGEIERKSDPLSTARAKCAMAAERTGADLVLASEGSFGPHPELYFIPANDEILVLQDKLNDIEIIARELSTETNFSGGPVQSEEELLSFAEKARFPSHALIIRPDAKAAEHIIKGITDHETLIRAFRETMLAHGRAHIETDMRAMFNPTRMKVIGRAAEKLAAKMASCCPRCSTPGFSITGALPGLPCSLCGTATRSPLAYIRKCEKCGVTEEEKFPNSKTTEDPGYCDQCNP
jgi:hypothetical protein